MNIGYSSRSIYDKCYYPDYMDESTKPLKHQLSVDQIYNCNNCLSSLGPRGRYGVSTPLHKTHYNESQYLTDIDSIMSNRNVKLSKCKRSKTNPIDVLKIKTYDKKYCGNYLDPESSLLSYPKDSYRGMGINRFYNTIHNAQDTIFWDFAVNTQLEAKDNYVPEVPIPWSDKKLLPHENKTEYESCTMSCSSNSRCPKSWRFEPSNYY